MIDRYIKYEIPKAAHRERQAGGPGELVERPTWTLYPGGCDAGQDCRMPGPAACRKDVPGHFAFTGDSGALPRRAFPCLFDGGH